MLSGLEGDQLKAVKAHKRPSFINAGAGTGKTYTVSRKLAYEFIQDEDDEEILPENVLAITFTAAAALEMSSRVRKITKTVSKDKARNITSAYISTIHAISRRILMENAFELKLDAGIEVISSSESEALLDDIIEDFFDKLKNGQNQTPGLSASEIELIDRNVVKNLVNTISHIGLSHIANGSASFTSYPTFGCKSYQESLKQMVDESEQTIMKKLNEASTNGVSIGNSSEKKLNKALSEAHIKSVSETNIDIQYKIGTGGQQQEEVRKKRNEISAMLLSINCESDMLHMTFGTWEIAIKLTQQYMETLRRNGKMTFDMILHYAASLEHEHVEIIDKLADNFDIAIIDEFQDTNALQFSIIKAICGGQENIDKLTCVGDKQQSIYRFQNADISVSDKAREEIGEEHVAKLNVNYRSHKDILNFVRDLFDFRNEESSSEPEIETLPFSDFLELTHSKSIAAQSQEIEAARIKAIQVKGTSAIEVSRASAWAAVQAIKEASADNIKGSKAILLNTMTNVEIYMNVLAEAGIPAAIRGGKIFYILKEIITVMNLVQAVLNVHDDNIVMLALIRMGISFSEIEEIKRIISDRQELKKPHIVDIIESLDNSHIRKEILTVLRILLDASHMIENNISAADVISYLVINTGYKTILLADELKGKGKWANVLKLIDIARINQSNQRLSTSQILHDMQNEFSLAQQKNNSSSQEKISPSILFENENDVVSIMTIHASKGLEFDLVIVGAENSMLPMKTGAVISKHGEENKVSVYTAGEFIPATKFMSDVQEIIDAENEETLQEKSRLLYVALTRAKQQLVHISGFKINKDEITGPPITTIAWNIIKKICNFGDEDTNKKIVIHKGKSDAYLMHVQSYQACDYIQDIRQKYAADDPQSFMRPVPMFSYALQLPYHDAPLEDKHYHSFTSITRSMRKDHDGDEIITSADIDENVKESIAVPAPSQYAELGTPEPLRYDANNIKYRRSTDWGTSFHSLAANMTWTGKVPADDVIASALSDNHINTQETGKMRALLERWLSSDARRNALDDAVSVDPEAPIFCPVELLEEDSNNVKSANDRDALIGYIDLLIQKEDGSLLIVDYKTGYKGVPSEEVARIYDLQMKIYAYAVLSSPENKSASVSAEIVLVENDCKVIGGSAEKWEWTYDDRDGLLSDIRAAISNGVSAPPRNDAEYDGDHSDTEGIDVPVAEQQRDELDGDQNAEKQKMLEYRARLEELEQDELLILLQVLSEVMRDRSA